mmetsp:Transcript_3270/g.5262  ORF Transcript_3270/g.5262 Transcript_3270/m.5262 type:complete len:147 (-) Transcript_3270:118-558(-)
MLGIVLSRGEGGSREPHQAASWFQKAAEQGDVSAMSFLGIMCYQGDGISQNFELAQIWIQKAANKGDPNAMLNYGVLYLEGKALTKDAKQAYKWLLAAKRLGKDDPDIQKKFEHYSEYARKFLTAAEEKEAKKFAKKFEPEGQSKP